MDEKEHLNNVVIFSKHLDYGKLNIDFCFIYGKKMLIRINTPFFYINIFTFIYSNRLMWMNPLAHNAVNTQ